jgi:hypothetical protein
MGEDHGRSSDAPRVTVQTAVLTYKDRSGSTRYQWLLVKRSWAAMPMLNIPA